MASESGAQALRLMAMDEDDLAILSAHVQDAVLHVRDMLFQPRERRFILALHRYDWIRTNAHLRVQAGLHFEHVRKAALHGFSQDRPDDILNLLSIVFAPGDAPSGEIVLTFSGGCAIKLEVECIEGRLADLGPRWPCKHAPEHARAAGEA
ncbi:hypothetical protein M2322_000471 [Rhodoblastus acidophilus]|uniref:DUF2948 family protein n=1 Tax=Rhodoblastus acidophilus TaxID=1074 RepID=UPI0022242977|nr:DUF2948 family protein [Rhodoblastus acidophilus]MCW2314951.1 hypothetical protein [Rhodoblastus acidophilus]